MTLSEGADKEIKCGLASRYFKRICRIPSKEDIVPEIEKLKPDVVVIDLDLYDRIGGIGKKVILRAIPYWHEHGTEKFVRDEEARYNCPECSHKLFRGAKRCNKCKVAVDLV